MLDYEFEKISILTRFRNLLRFKLHPSWERLFVVSAGVLLNILVCYLLGLENHFKLIIIVSLFIQGFMVQKLPRKQFIHSVLTFSIVVALAFFTASIGAEYIYLAVIFFIMWFAYFTFIHLSEYEVSQMGVFTVFIYFFAFIQISHISTNTFGLIETSLLYALAGFLMVVVGSIPVLIVNYIRHDPYKRELLAEMFKPGISFNKLLKNQAIIASNDNSQRTQSLVNMAIKLYILDTNVDNLRYTLDDDLEKQFDKFLKEVYRLLNKVEIAIYKGYDEDLELNTGYIIGFQKNLSYRLGRLENKTDDQEFLLRSVKRYAKMFINLNKVLDDQIVIDDIDLKEIKGGYFENVKNNFNKTNVDLRYSIRFVIAGIMSFIADILLGNSGFGITIISELTLSPDHRSTGQTVVLRIISTIFAIIVSFLIAELLLSLHIGYIVMILAVLALLLYYVFNTYAISIFFLILGLMLLKPITTISETIIEEIIATAVALGIVLFANYCILPSKKHYNISELIATKIKLTGDYIENTFNNNGEDAIHDVDVYTASNEFNSAIDKFESLYNLGNDLYSFKEISDTLNNLRNTSLLIALSSKGKDHDLIIEVIHDFFTKMNEAIRTEEPVLHVTHDFDELENYIKQLSESSKSNRLLAIKYEHMLTDLEYINDIVIKTEREKIFNKYNRDL